MDALHLLGLVFYQNGQPDIALPLIARALSTGTTTATTPSNNGTTATTASAVAAAAQHHVDQYNTDSSSGSSSASLSGSQDDAQRANLHNSMGQCLRAVGRTQEATAQYKLALSLQTDFTVAKVCCTYSILSNVRCVTFCSILVLACTVIHVQRCARLLLIKAMRYGHFF